MKQIIPFKKDLLFKTKVSEVTSISLEHSFNINEDIISGEFHISGDYKMTDGSIRRESFEFNLPFDIALDSRYRKESMIVDIDNFYYKIVNDDTLQVNIDLYVDGEKFIDEKERKEEIKFEDLVDELKTEEKDICNDNLKDEGFEREVEYDKPSKEDYLMDNKILGESEIEESKNINHNISENKSNHFNVFENDDSETYKAYYVYIVKNDDTIDKILEKYHITKEEVAIYNDLENIKMGDKIIIPSKNE